MSIPTTWTINYACGHTGDLDMSNKRVDQRAGYAKWLQQRDCFDCYKNRQGTKESAERAKERAAALERVAISEQRSGLEGLTGTEKQQSWARVIRGDILAGLYDLYVASGQHDEGWFESEILAPAQRIATSRWWINNRDMGLPEFPELLAAGADSEDATENVT